MEKKLLMKNIYNFLKKTPETRTWFYLVIRIFTYYSLSIKNIPEISDK